MYQYWARIYESTAKILVSDTRDVFFQSNPFEYVNLKKKFSIFYMIIRYIPIEWDGSELSVFLEAYPNMVGCFVSSLGFYSLHTYRLSKEHLIHFPGYEVAMDAKQ